MLPEQKYSPRIYLFSIHNLFICQKGIKIYFEGCQENIFVDISIFYFSYLSMIIDHNVFMLTHFQIDILFFTNYQSKLIVHDSIFLCEKLG